MGPSHPVYPRDSTQVRALDRAYPLAKQLAEVLELEAIEPVATMAKRVRQVIGTELADAGARVLQHDQLRPAPDRLARPVDGQPEGDDGVDMTGSRALLR